MVDRVRPHKMESPESGGTQSDPFPTAANPNQDHLDVRGVVFQDDSSDDELVRVSRDSSKRAIFLDNENSRTLTQLAAFPVDEFMVDTPPGTPSAGYRVVVGDSPTGDFVGHEGEIAQWDATATAWLFTDPEHGTILFARDMQEPYAQRASGSPWDWRRVYARTHWGSEEDEASTNSATWVVFLRVPDTGTLDLESGDYRLLATILAWGTSVSTQVGLRVREDETTTLCENTVVPDVTGDAKQPCIAMKILESLSGGHYYTLEFNRTSAPGVAYVSNGTLTLQRI